MAIMELTTKPLEEILKVFNNRKIILGIDVDNCLTDTNPVILELANEMYYYPNPYYKKVLERPLTEEDITDFDYGKCTPLNDDEVDELFHQMAEREKYLHLKILPYAAEIIHKLEDIFHSLRQGYSYRL